MAKYPHATFKFVLKLFIICLVFHCTFGAPTFNPEFEEFYKYLNSNHCSLPKQIKLGASPEEIANFQFLAEPLGVCQTLEPSKHAATEAAFLCHEIYENFKNITCTSRLNDDSFEIQIPLSTNVCGDFGSLQISLTLESENKIKKPILTDNLVCEIVCTDEFKPTCKFLLWTYQVLQKINDVGINQQNAANPHDTENIPNQEETKINSPILTKSSEKANEENSKTSPIDKTPESTSTVSTANVSDQMIKNQLPTNISDEIAVKNSDNVNEKVDTKNDISEDIHLLEPVLSVHDQTSKENLKVSNNSNVAKLEGNNNAIAAANLKEKVVNDDGDTDLKDNLKIVNNGNAEDNAMDIGPNQNTPKLTSNPQSTTKVNVQVEEMKSPFAVSKTEDNTKVTAVTGSNSSSPVESSSSSKVTLPKVLISPKLNMTTASDKSKSDPESTSTISSFSEISSVVPISSTVQNAPLEKMEGADNVKVPDENTEPQYVETENGDVEYGENPLEEDKQKEPYTENLKPEPAFKPVIEVENEHPHNFENLQPNRYSEPNFPVFPEQEDSHFFFYFVSMVLIFMAVYLLVHNKQKIIALIVEGRHERRRRSHGTGYKKLEAK